MAKLDAQKAANANKEEGSIFNFDNPIYAMDKKKQAKEEVATEEAQTEE